MHTADSLLNHVYKVQFEFNQELYGEPCTFITLRVRDVPGIRTLLKTRVKYFPQGSVVDTITRGINHTLDHLAQHLNAGNRRFDSGLLSFEVQVGDVLFGKPALPAIVIEPGVAAPWIQYCQIDAYVGGNNDTNDRRREPGIKCYVSTGRYHHSSMVRVEKTTLERFLFIIPDAFAGIELSPHIPVETMNLRIKETYESRYNLNDRRVCTVSS